MGKKYYGLRLISLLGTGLIGSWNFIGLPTLSQTVDESDFAQQVNPLIKRQLTLIEGIETAIATEEFNRLEALRGQLFLHLGTVNRFLTVQYWNPASFCGGNAQIPANLDRFRGDQQQVYCSLYESQKQLQSLMPWLDYRLAILAGMRQQESIDILDPTSWTIAETESLSPEPALIGQATKLPVMFEGNNEVTSPIIIPLPQAVTLLQNAKNSLLNIANTSPVVTSFFAPSLTALNPSNEFPETERYSTLLTQPNTGLLALSATESNQFQPLLLTPQEPTRFQALFPTSQPEYVPQLILELTERNFKIGSHPLAYGFMNNVGDIALDDIEPQLQNLSRLSPLEKDFFLRYTPPETLKNIQIDRRRFRFGKAGLGETPSLYTPVFSEVVAQLNQTYLLRLIQYQLPDVILNNEPISRARRQEIDALLTTPSSDLLIAFRPVRRRLDGSYIILWRVLNEFENPQITDLEEYVDLE